MQESQLYDRVFGCLLGAAIGDAMGQPRRGLDWHGVQERFGADCVFEPWTQEGVSGLRYSPGTMGDLARLAIRLSARAGGSGSRPRTSLLVDELLNTEHLNSLPAQAALARIRAGMEPSRSAVPELAGPEALYIAIPVGAGNIGDPEAAFLAARAIAGPILLGPSLEAGQVFAAGIAAALMPESRPGSVLDVMLDLAPPSVSRVLQPAALFASEHLGHPSDSLMPAIHDRFSTRSATDTHGPAVEALAVACLLTYLNDARPEQSIRSAVAYGAWAHAAGAAAGALAGASSGASAIPEDWKRKVLSANPDVDIPVASLMLCRSIELECGRQKSRLSDLDSMLGRTARA